MFLLPVYALAEFIRLGTLEEVLPGCVCVMGVCHGCICMCVCVRLSLCVFVWLTLCSFVCLRPPLSDKFKMPTSQRA